MLLFLLNWWNLLSGWGMSYCVSHSCDFVEFDKAKGLNCYDILQNEMLFHLSKFSVISNILQI